MSEQTTTPTYLTVEEAADYLRVQPDTLRRWQKEGKIDYYKMPNGPLFSHAFLDKFMAQRASPRLRKLRGRV